MTTEVQTFFGKIHQGDCIAGMNEIETGTIDLVFADPPFNIGFEYDEYDDSLEDEQYLQWSRDWMSQVHRILKNDGTFWLAIGDEYAAELKVKAQSIGFHCRSWVIWYYTFGVNCKKKFTRSHAHLFHFVKDPKNFVFNHDDLDVRVPSARRLVYNDARANPNGRMPDDTWILRPQELVNGFEPDEDTWHFPRVAGTFKERAGFHGCQMPEQLLARIIRTCSSEGDTVIDPFSGSSTTLAVAKKLGRNYFGFELSQEYVRLGEQRLEKIRVGDPLNGSEEPNMNTLLAKDKKAAKQKAKQKSKPNALLNKKRKKSDDRQLSLFAAEEKIHSELTTEMQGIIEAFSTSNRGFSVDRLVADPILNQDFQLACQRQNVPGTEAERNRFLFRIRQAGKLKSNGVDTSAPTKLDWKAISPFVFASEIAWRKIGDVYSMSLNEIFCDPRIAVQFDKIASSFAPGYEPLEYRWAALKLRKEGSAAKKRAKSQTAKKLGVSSFDKKGIKEVKGQLLSKIKFGKVSKGPGVFLIQELDGSSLYAGETDRLSATLTEMFKPDSRSAWLDRCEDLQIFLLPLETVTDFRLARQSWLLKWHKPEWNAVESLGC